MLPGSETVEYRVLLSASGLSLHACTNGVLAQQSPPGARAVAIRERIEGLKEMAQAAASTGGSVDCGEKPP